MNKQSRLFVKLFFFIFFFDYYFSHFNILFAIPIKLNNADIELITQKIFHNECSKSYEKLVYWNPHETFPSLGIGHFIWVPSKANVSFSQTFPDLLDYLEQHGIKIPSWINDNKECPWNTRDEFLSVKSSGQRKELFLMLKNSLELQVQFMISRLINKLDYMLDDLSPAVSHKVSANITLLLQTKNGIYALIDYLNFKGDGLNKREHYNGHYWGLKQVLCEMSKCSDVQQAISEFIRSAQLLLSQRIAHAPRNESHWRAGWFNRLESYRVPFS